MSERDSGSGFFTGLFLGGLVGAALGLLLAPRPGQETLEQIKEKGAAWREGGEDFLEEETTALRVALDDIRESLRETIEEGKEVLREIVEEGKEATAKATAELQAQYEAAREGREKV